jgi:hypothetical protein
MQRIPRLHLSVYLDNLTLFVTKSLFNITRTVIFHMALSITLDFTHVSSYRGSSGPKLTFHTPHWEFTLIRCVPRIQTCTRQYPSLK